MTNRRDFVKLAGVSALASTVTLGNAKSSYAKEKAEKKYSLGFAGYSFNYWRGNVDKVIEIMKAVGVTRTTLKDFHLPYNATQSQADEIVGKFKNAGLEIYGLGVIYLKSQEDVDNAFKYAQTAGVKMLVISPAYEVIPYIDTKSKQTQIKVAIHNHGPEDKLFPDIDSIHARIKDMNPMMGICLDIGHSFRCGHNPAEMLLKFKDRVYDMHIKDVEGQFEKAASLKMGQGKIDLPSIVKALDKSGYSGSCSLEYEVKGTGDDAIYGIPECIGYFRGLMNAFKYY